MLLANLLFASTVSWSSTASIPVLPPNEVKFFQSWMVTIIEDQVSRGINPRWNQRDCAGLVRFAVAESLATHDAGWRKANGFLGRPLPPEIEINQQMKQSFKVWKSSDGEKSQFVRALPLVQQNAIFMGKSPEKLEPGDLLFFDQGEDQHIMIWTGQRIVYHNGHRPSPKEKTSDNGLRTVRLDDLMSWNDSRWRPVTTNPNFVGFYRLSFLVNQNAQGTL